MFVYQFKCTLNKTKLSKQMKTIEQPFCTNSKVRNWNTIQLLKLDEHWKTHANRHTRFKIQNEQMMLQTCNVESHQKCFWNVNKQKRKRDHHLGKQPLQTQCDVKGRTKSTNNHHQPGNNTKTNTSPTNMNLHRKQIEETRPMQQRNCKNPCTTIQNDENTCPCAQHPRP